MRVVAVTTAADFPDGARRNLLFRRWRESGKPKEKRTRATRQVYVNRSAGPLLGIFYSGPLLESVADLTDYAESQFGGGHYKIVVQEVIGGRWMHVTSELVLVP